MPRNAAQLEIAQCEPVAEQRQELLVDDAKLVIPRVQADRIGTQVDEELDAVLQQVELAQDAKRAPCERGAQSQCGELLRDAAARYVIVDERRQGSRAVFMLREEREKRALPVVIETTINRREHRDARPCRCFTAKRACAFVENAPHARDGEARR